MQESRVRNTANAFIWNLYNVVITSLFPFLIRTLLIRYIGLEYTGISSLFTSIMQIVNLADLGFESAICFFLYRSMAERDDRYTGSLLHYLKSIYHKIGVVIFVISILLLPVLHLFLQCGDAIFRRVLFGDGFQKRPEGRCPCENRRNNCIYHVRCTDSCDCQVSEFLCLYAVAACEFLLVANYGESGSKKEVSGNKM